MSFTNLVNLISTHIVTNLRSLPKEFTDEVYAVSLFMDKADIEQPALSVSFNTTSQIASALAGKSGAWGSPSDKNEAKWNYAFWLQTPCSNFLVQSESEDGILWQFTCKENGLVYSEDDDFDIDQYEESIGKLLADLAVAVSLDIHSSNVLTEVFGKKLPIIIHELEYYDEIATLTKSGNPEGVADEFIEWVSSL